ncbi:MAG TPA: hypothetical protein VMZ06_10025 [Candidatus Bathyarchaeia archaeon]|nr:hypothetical protein [Candidatus Bathyarchaeia archaeon]
MRVSRGVRNVSAVLLAFFLMAVLIVLARFRPPARVLPPESPEIARLRFSRTENAWFVLQEADGLIPPDPFVDLRTTVDFKFGVMGLFTGFYLADDHPEHVAWVRGCKPAIDRVRDALKMDHLLMPLEFPSTEEPWRRMRPSDAFSGLPSIMLATAALETKAGNSELVFDCYRDALRLALMLRNSIPETWLRDSRSLCKLARQFDPQVQREALEWLIEFNARKPLPRRAVEDWLRLHESWKGGWKEIFRPLDPQHMPYLVAALARSGPARRVFAANVEAILDACCLTTHEYRQWEKRFPELADAAVNSFPGFHPYSLFHRNIEFQICLDVMEFVLAVELYRHAHGAYPESLAALAPEFLTQAPNNARSGEPFYYRRAENNYWLALRGQGDDPRRLIYSDILVSPPED